MKNIFNKISKKLRGGLQKLRKKKPDNKGLSGYDLLNNPRHNKSTGFTQKERDNLGLRGLLPHKIRSLDCQKERALENLRSKTSDIEKYIYLSELQGSNETLFYQLAIENIEEIMPLIYTPTVGEACKNFARIFQNTKGLYITPDDKGKIRDILDNWPEEDIRALVVTDGERILGLGDLGANGMGIPLGKLSLYTICGGIDPAHCLPVMFDIGTNNDVLRNDPLYLGYPHKRLSGQAYDELMAEFVSAVQDKFPKAMIQFEDFLTPNAYKLLKEYRHKVTCFNDDIQGTAAVALAGVYASTRISGKNYKDLKIMFLGAGSAATGIGDLMTKAFEEAGLSKDDAKQQLWFVDSKGLVVKDRGDELAPHKTPYAHDHPPIKDFVDAINEIKPDILIGATGFGGSFTQEVIEAMSALNEHPAIFALSNPTSHAECTAEQAYKWSKGKAIFSSGSPFDPIEVNGKILKPGQANNAYIFPGLGLGVIAAEATEVTEEMFLAAADALAELVNEQSLKTGTLYPPLTDIRKVSSHIAKAVMEKAFEQGVAKIKRPANLEKYIQEIMYNPSYSQPKNNPHPAPKKNFKP